MIIDAPTVEKFDSLKKSEIEGMITQINHAFSQGVPPQESVSFPAYVLAQLLQTVKVLESRLPKPDESVMSDLLSSVSDAEDAEDEEESDETKKSK